MYHVYYSERVLVIFYNTKNSNLSGYPLSLYRLILDWIGFLELAPNGGNFQHRMLLRQRVRKFHGGEDENRGTWAQKSDPAHMLSFFARAGAPPGQPREVFAIVRPDWLRPTAAPATPTAAATTAMSRATSATATTVPVLAGALSWRGDDDGGKWAKTASSTDPPIRRCLGYRTLAGALFLPVPTWRSPAFADGSEGPRRSPGPRQDCRTPGQGLGGGEGAPAAPNGRGA